MNESTLKILSQAARNAAREVGLEEDFDQHSAIAGYTNPNATIQVKKKSGSSTAVGGKPNLPGLPAPAQEESTQPVSAASALAGMQRGTDAKSVLAELLASGDTLAYGAAKQEFDAMEAAKKEKQQKAAQNPYGGAQALQNALSIKAEALNRRAESIADFQAKLEKRIADFNAGRGTDTQEQLNREIAALTLRKDVYNRDLAAYEKEYAQMSGIIREGVQAVDAQIAKAQRDVEVYFSDAHGEMLDRQIQDAYERQAAQAAAERDGTSLPNSRSASELWDEYLAAQDRYSQWETEKAEYSLSILPNAERQLLNRYVEAKNNQSTSYGKNYTDGYYSGEEVKSRRKAVVDHFGKERAEQLIQMAERSYNAKRQAEQNQKMAEYAQRGVGEAIVASVASIVTNALSAPGVLVSTLAQKLHNPNNLRTLDTNTAGFSMQNATRSFLGGVESAIMPDEKNATAGQKAGVMLYSTLMSGLNSLVASLLPGKAGAVLLGATAATNTMQDVTERGGTMNQAITAGVVSGVFECLFEDVSIGKFKALQEKSNVRSAVDFLQNVGKSIGVNASEEAATELANILYDSVALGDVSNYAIRLRELMEDEDMDERKAKQTLAGELAMQVMESAVSGALMGGVFGVLGSTTAAGNTKRKDLITNTLMLDGLIDQGLSYPGTEIFDIAAQMQERRNAGKLVPSEEIMALAEKIQNQISRQKAQGAGMAEATNARAVEEMMEVPEALEGIAAAIPQKVETGAAEVKSQIETDLARNAVQETEGEDMNVRTTEEVQEAETQAVPAREEVRLETVAPAVQESVRAEVATGNTSALPTVENAAQVNTGENTTLSEAEAEIRGLAQMYQGEGLRQAAQNLANNMRMAGETAYAEEIEAAAAKMLPRMAVGAVSANNMTAPEVGTAVQMEEVDYGREGETGGVRLRAGGERNDGQSTGRQTAGVAETAGRTPAADERRQLSAKQSKSKRIAERIARGGGKSTRAATGLTNASSNSRYQVYELEDRDMDAEAYEIINDATANGYEAHLYYKGLYFNVKAGRTIRVDGARSGDRLYIRMDAEHFTGRQIANHEMFHALAEGNPGLVDAIMQDIMSEYTEDELEELLAYYEDLYDGAYNEAERNRKIVEELCADAYAGMDRANVEVGKESYARVSQKTEAVRGMTERRTGLRAIGERGVAETRAGPANGFARETVVENETGEPVAYTDGNGAVVFSLSTYDIDGRRVLDNWLKKEVSVGNLSQEDADDIRNNLEYAYDICNKYRDQYAPFGEWSDAKVELNEDGTPVMSVVKANGEYAMNLDFSLVCKKRRALDAVFNEMIRRGIMEEMKLGQEDIVRINRIIKEHGFEVACDLCFVDAKRYRQAGVADAFATMWNGIVRSMAKGKNIASFNFGGDETIQTVENGIDTMDDSELDFGRIDAILKKGETKKVPYKIAEYLKNHPEDRKLISRGDFMSTKGFEKALKTKPGIMKLYNSKKGSGGPKAAFGDVQYLNDIIQSGKFIVEKAFDVGGVRIQSFSDYVPRMVFDYWQMVADLAAKKLPAHAYTKEAAFVRMFGLTGIKINMSLIPKVVEGGLAPGLDADGNYAWADESFDFDTAVELQGMDGYTENVGTIAVGVSKEHILKLLRDDRIRMVIPYHKSGLNPTVAHMLGIHKFKDATTTQNTRYGNGKKLSKEDHEKEQNFNQRLHELGENGDPKKVAQEYLDWCDENGYLPKFDEYRNEENYYKLLEDFTVYDRDGKYVPQKAVRMVQPGNFSELVEQGLEADAINQAKLDDDIGNIVDEIVGMQTARAKSFSLASGQSFEQVEERIDELEGLMENLAVEKDTMDPAEFQVRWFNLQMEKGALESELFDRRQAEERQRLREEAKARQALAEELNPQIEARRAKAREYEREARAAEQRYEKTKDAGELEEAKRLRDRAAQERRAANEMQKQLRGEVKVKNAQRVYRPDMAIRRTQDRILDLFHIQAGSRGEAKQALTGILLDAMKTGYVGQETLETVLRQMYSTGIEVVPAPEIYQDIANTLKGRKIYVSGEVKAAYGDDWNRVRGQLLGAGIYTTSDRAEMGVDSVYAELAGQYPGVFDENNVDMRGMLDELLEAAQLGKAEHRTLSESAAAQGLDSEEDFWNLYRLTSEELARFADAAGVESRVRSAKEWQIAQQKEESSARQKKLLAASRARAEEIRREEQGKRQAMLARRQRTEMMDRLRRQITRLNRKAEQNDALLTKALRNLDEGTVSIARQAMETVDLISNGFRKSTQKDLLALRESIGLAKQDNPDFEEDALEILKNALQEKAEYRDMEAGKFDQRAKARLDQALNALDRLGKRQLTDMNIDDLNAMADAIEAIVHEIDNLDKMLGELWDANVDETANRIREEVGRTKGISRSANNSTVRGKARHLLVEQSLSPSRMLARLVGYDRSGAMGNVIREFEQGDLRSMQYALDADLIFGSFLKDRENQKWLRRATGKNAELITLELPLVMEYGEGDAPVYDPEATTTVQVSQMMLVQMALDLENEANIRHAERGGYTFPNVDAMRKENREAMYTGAKVVKMPREVIARIVQENLSGEGQAFARLLHRYYNGTSKTAINETSQMLHGVDVARVKNYYPIHTNDDYRGQEYNVFDATLESMGSLKERQQGAVAPILLEDAAETFRWHRDNMAKYVGYAVARRNFVALLNHRNAGGVTLRAEIEQKWGNTAGDSIDEFFRILETGKLEEVSDVLSGLQSKYAGAVLSFNVGSMMKQLGALPLAGSTVGHGAILRGLLNPKLGRKQREFIRKYTPYLDYRGKGYTYREIAEAAGKGIQSERVYKTLDYLTGRNWLEAMDIKVNTSLWHAAEYAVRRDTALRPGSQADIEAGVDPYYKAVADVFNRMTHDTQTNYNLMSRPPVLMRKGTVIRAATMFRTDAYQTAGVLRESIGAYAQAVRNRKAAKTEEARAQCEEKARKAGQTVARSIAGVIGNSMISVIVDELRQLLRGNDEDYFDEEGNFRWGSAAAKVGQKVLMNVAGCFTFVEEIAEYLEAKIKGERYYEPEISRLGMLLDGAESLWKFGETVWNIVRDANELRENGGDVESYLRREADAIFDCTKDMIEKLSFLLGIPLKNMERTITTALGWILPEAAVAYDDMFTDYSKALLRDMSERELPYGIDAYLRDNCSITDDAVRDEYLRLYETVGDSMMPGANPPDKIVTGEGEERVERELTLTDTGRWDSKYREIMIDETKRMIESEAYKNLTDKEKAAALAKLDEYAKKVADEYIGHDVDAWVERSINVGADAVNISVYKAATKDMKSGEAYQWIVESGMTQKEAIEVLGVEMQDKDGHTNGYHEMVKAVNEHGIELSEWADLYELGSSRVEAFNKWCEDGLKPETAITLAETMDALEPEPGKEQVSNMQKYRAIDASGLNDEEKLNAMSVLLGMEMETESGEPSQRAKMLRVVETGASLTDYLDIKEAGGVDNYLEAVDLGLNREKAKEVVEAVDALPKLPKGEEYTSDQKTLAALSVCDTAEEQIIVYATYGSSDDVITTTAKFTAAAKYDVTPEMYLKAKALAKADFNKDNNNSLNSKEVEAALRSMDLTNRQRAALWQMFGINWKKNPFGNTADIRTAYEKAVEEKKKQKD